MRLSGVASEQERWQQWQHITFHHGCMTSLLLPLMFPVRESSGGGRVRNMYLKIKQLKQHNHKTQQYTHHPVCHSMVRDDT